MISAFPQVKFRNVTLTKTNTFTLGKVSYLKEETEKTEEMHGESLGFFTVRCKYLCCLLHMHHFLQVYLAKTLPIDVIYTVN